MKYHRHFIMILHAVYVMLPRGIKQAVPPLVNINSGSREDVRWFSYTTDREYRRE